LTFIAYNVTTTDPEYYTTNPNFSELLYTQALTPYLEALGLPAKFIIDTGRSGQTGIMIPGAWCNINNAGIGYRPTTDTGNVNVDALVWAKPPGDSDGSSTLGSTGSDTSCTGSISLKPAPAPGVW
jgi:cellulose 1,4-beta-cellobiosidase